MTERRSSMEPGLSTRSIRGDGAAWCWMAGILACICQVGYSLLLWQRLAEIASHDVIYHCNAIPYLTVPSFLDDRDHGRYPFDHAFVSFHDLTSIYFRDQISTAFMPNAGLPCRDERINHATKHHANKAKTKKSSPSTPKHLTWKK
jgi:hypothetical protein